ncbi:stage II sporulation protein P [Clostridium pasteurianum]|uniref:Stage II sporulation protein P n=1 Tax=Clostridium pasteurianum BC1 TaxID=86416 RepID=R4K976_CLOPA|nr:stage II sporulation protein P [Clostridium pasteurianum]AGK97064.1 stage II sporulation protein P [Clostridium pasteurianum BC1]
MVNVNKRINNGKNSFILILGVTIMIFSIYIFFSFFNVQETQEKLTGGRGNMLYVQLVNYVMPIVKVTNFDEEDMAESTLSLKSGILNYIGINLSHPDEILKKEVSYFREDNNSVAYNSNDTGIAKISDFNLKDSDITKNSTNNSSGDSSNPSNQTFQIYNPKLKKNLDNSKPEVLIYHSHTTESYGQYGPDNLDPTKNVCAVGDELAKELSNNYGISVIHDTTIHNVLAYNKSYERSGETLDKYLKKYGDFKMIIDMHRDSDPNKNDVTAKINGENVAKFMFVMARKNPHFDKNMTIVNALLNSAKKNFPGLVIGNGIYYYDYGMNFFNQAKSNNAFLLEVGSTPNTLDESKATSKYIARMIAEYINGK